MNLGTLNIVRVARATTTSEDIQARMVARELPRQAHCAEHLGVGEHQAVEHLRAYVLGCMSLQGVPKGVALEVQYSVAKVRHSGRIGVFFVSSSATFTAVLE